MDSFRVLLLTDKEPERTCTRFGADPWPGIQLEAIRPGQLAQGLLADVLVVEPSVPEPLGAARVFRQANPSGQVMFLLPGDRLDKLQRMLPFAPELAGSRAIDQAMPAAQLRQQIEEAAATGKNRQAVKGLYSRINARVGGHAAAAEAQSDRQRQHLALAERYLEALLTHAPDALFATALDGSVVSWNDAAARLFGRSWDDMAGRSFVALFLPDDRTLAARVLERAGMGESIRAQELRIASPEGTIRILELSAGPVLGGDGAIVGISLTARDITERKEADSALRRLNEELESRIASSIAEREKTEAALRQSQKLEAVGQLTGGVAHDFNNLLTIIRSSVDLLRRPNLPEERRTRYVNSISDTVDRAAKLTGQLLAFARRQPLKPEVFDVSHRVEFAVDMIRTLVGSRIAIETRLECHECFVEADVSQFETALINLAVNARDAMAGEGRLTVVLRETSEVPPIRAHKGGKGDFVAVSIADTGSGIPPDQLGRIFEPFYTTKEVGKGTGLGLSQVYGFAKQSGGEIDVESEVGRGTMFTFYLPRAHGKAALSEVPRGERADFTGPRRRRLLLVEDNADVGAFTTQMLQELGYETTWASNADEALRCLRSDPNGFDVMFSDVVMPGMSGIELGQEVQKHYAHMPVVLTSGYSHILAEEGRHGFELLQKPYSVEELLRVLNHAIRRNQS